MQIFTHAQLAKARTVRIWRDHVASACVLLFAILLANAMTLTAFYRDNPILFVSKIAVGVMRGPIPGFPNWLDPNIGYTTQALGYLCAQDWLHGEIPWWDPYQGVGVPLGAELQNGAFFLPFSLLLHFNAGWLMLRLLMQVMAGLFTYALLIQLRLSRLAALLGGVMFGCSSTFIILADAPSKALPFLPLLLLGIEQGLASRRQFAPGWSLVIIAVAYSFYAGFPETGFLADLFGGLWFAVRLMGCEGAVWPAMIRRFTVAVGIGIALTLPGLAPFLGYVGHGYIGDHATHYATASLPLVGLTTQILPLAFGPLHTSMVFLDPGQKTLAQLTDVWLNTGGWFGLVPSIFAVVGLITGPPPFKRTAWFLLGWILLFEARIFGFPAAVAMINLVSPLRLIEMRSYVEPSIDFAVILLAAIGIDQWLSRPIPSYLWRRIGILLLGMLLVVFGVGYHADRVLKALVPALWHVLLIYDAMAIIGALTLLYVISQPPAPARRWLLSTALMIDCIAGYGYSQAAGATRGHLDLSGVAYLRSHQGLQRAYTLGPLAPNYGSQYRVAEINTNMLPIPQRWHNFIHQSLDPFQSTIAFVGGNFNPLPAQDSAARMLRKNLSAYQALGVRYILTLPYTDPLHIAQNPVFISKAMWIYRLDHAAPYFATIPGSGCIITAPKRTSVQISCAKPCALIRRELFYPGWHARVNGHAVTVRKAAPLFQQIDLPAGRSKIRFFYRPPFERRACAAAGLGLLLWLALVLIGAKREVAQ